LTFQAFKENIRNYVFVKDIDNQFDKKAKSGQILVDDNTKRYAWCIDKKVLTNQNDLLDLSLSAKATIYVCKFGTDKCFDLNCCSLIAINYIITDCWYHDIGIILDTPLLVNSIISPDMRITVNFEGLYVSMTAYTPFELFSAGIKDVCQQVKEKIQNPIATSTIYKIVMDTNSSLDAYAVELAQLNPSVKEVK